MFFRILFRVIYFVIYYKNYCIFIRFSFKIQWTLYNSDSHDEEINIRIMECSNYRQLALFLKTLLKKQVSFLVSSIPGLTMESLSTLSSMRCVIEVMFGKISSTQSSFSTLVGMGWMMMATCWKSVCELWKDSLRLADPIELKFSRSVNSMLVCVLGSVNCMLVCVFREC